MRVSLVTSPHLDHSIFHRREGWVDGVTRFAQCFVPMGLLSLAGSIETVAAPLILDINKAINAHRLPMSPVFYEAAAGWILDTAPDVVGIMTESDSYHHVLRITQALKARQSAVVTVLGGPYASGLHRETIEAFPSVDYVLRGEGEIAFQQLLRSLSDEDDRNKVGNLTWRTASGGIAVNAELPLLPDLDALPWPDLKRIQLADEDIIYLEVGRGCPFRCNFCFTAPYWKRKHRIKSSERVIAEIVHFRDVYGRTDFNFTHDLLTTDRRWVLDFCRKAVDQQLGVTWTCSSRTDTLDSEQITWMRRAGCRDIYFGVETGTPEMQVAIDKNLDLAQSRAIIRAAADAGIGATVGFIAGLPGESDTSLRGTLTEAFHYLTLENATVHLFGFQPYKGSSKFEEIQNDLVLDDRFIDFPLSKGLHAETAAMMRAHFDVFARYGRLQRFRNVPQEIVRTAEEFFPIVNALRSLMMHLIELGLDPFEMLILWSHWIGQENERAGNVGSGMYAGTIDQFIGFLASSLPTLKLWNPMIEEMLRWEKAKNRVRVDTSLAPMAAAPNDEAEVPVIVRNPTLIVECFEHAEAFLSNVSTSGSSYFGFYRHADNRPAIVTFGSLAALMLDIARLPMSIRELAQMIDASGSGQYAQHSAIVRATIENLCASELLVRHIESDLAHQTTTPLVKRRRSLSSIGGLG